MIIPTPPPPRAFNVELRTAVGKMRRVVARYFESDPNCEGMIVFKGNENSLGTATAAFSSSAVISIVEVPLGDKITDPPNREGMIVFRDANSSGTAAGPPLRGSYVTPIAQAPLGNKNTD